ncbi:MAG: ClpX C4-type zinc finger protein [Bacteroidales bacterium]
MAKKIERCSFCGREKDQTNVLIAGLDAHICDYCVTQAQSIISEEITTKTNKQFTKIELQKPIEIKKYIDQYVIGQDEAKIILAVAVYNHFKRITQPTSKNKKDETEIEKANIIMVGETGTGKTLLARTIAKCLKFRFALPMLPS